MTSQPINPPKPHQKVELAILNKFAKFRHYTPNNKNVMMGGGGGHFVPFPPGCDEPKMPGPGRVKLTFGKINRKD